MSTSAPATHLDCPHARSVERTHRHTVGDGSGARQAVARCIAPPWRSRAAGAQADAGRSRDATLSQRGSPPTASVAASSSIAGAASAAIRRSTRSASTMRIERRADPARRRHPARRTRAGSAKSVPAQERAYAGGHCVRLRCRAPATAPLGSSRVEPSANADPSRAPSPAQLAAERLERGRAFAAAGRRSRVATTRDADAQREAPVRARASRFAHARSRIARDRIARLPVDAARRSAPLLCRL